MPNTFIPTEPVLGFRQGSVFGADTSSTPNGQHGTQYQPGMRVQLNSNRLAYYVMTTAGIALSATLTIEASGTATSADAGGYVALGSAPAGGGLWAIRTAVFVST